MKNGRFEVGDIVTGNGKRWYCITNQDMTKGKVINVNCNNHIDVEILEHRDADEIGVVYYGLISEYFTLVQDVDTPFTTFNVTTDMKTFVNWTTDKGKTYTSKCMKCDTFDLKTGVELAIDRMEDAEKVKEMPKYVRILHADNSGSGLKVGDITKVLTCHCGLPDWLYVACPEKSHYDGDAAKDCLALVGQNFELLTPSEYEPVTIYG